MTAERDDSTLKRGCCKLPGLCGAGAGLSQEVDREGGLTLVNPRVDDRAALTLAQLNSPGSP
jgi:hypothetical protein